MVQYLPYCEPDLECFLSVSSSNDPLKKPPLIISSLCLYFDSILLNQFWLASFERSMWFTFQVIIEPCMISSWALTMFTQRLKLYRVQVKLYDWILLYSRTWLAERICLLNFLKLVRFQKPFWLESFQKARLSSVWHIWTFFMIVLSFSCKSSTFLFCKTLRSED